MPHFSDRILAIQPTGVRKMFDMAGEDSINLGLGEPDFQPPPVAIEAFHQAMLDGQNKYTTTAGMPELREEIAKGWSHLEPSLTMDSVCVTQSGTNALLDCMMTFLNEGDNILIPDPYFVLYKPHTILMGAEPRFYSLTIDNEFLPDISELDQLVDENTKAILVNYPSNPTGANINIKKRDEVLDFARKHDLWVISDEVYDKMVYEGEHISFLGGGYENVVMVNSFSKTYAMTGWRIGYLLSANPDAMEQLTKMQYYTTACTSQAMQSAVLAAMRDASEFPAEMTAVFKERRDLIIKRLNDMEGVECLMPKGAFYAFPKVKVPGYDSGELAIEMLKAGVICSPGSAFGESGEGYLRFSYVASNEDLERGMDIVENCLKRLMTD